MADIGTAKVERENFRTVTAPVDNAVPLELPDVGGYITPRSVSARFVQAAANRPWRVHEVTVSGPILDDPEESLGEIVYPSTLPDALPWVVTFTQNALMTMTSGSVHVLTCERCSRLFTATRPDARFCTTRCQVAAYRARVKAALEKSDAPEETNGDTDAVGAVSFVEPPPQP